MATRSELSQGSTTEQNKQQMLAFFSTLQRKNDSEIEKLFIERLAANFNAVFEKRIKESLNKVDQQTDLSKSVSFVREEIVALYQFLYQPIVEEHLSEEIIAMPTKHRLLHVCERLFELFEEFKNSVNVGGLKYNFRDVLSDVLKDVVLKTFSEINQSNKKENNLSIEISEDKDKLEVQLGNLIKAQHIGEVLAELEKIKSKSKDKAAINSLISQLLALPYRNAYDYVNEYLYFVKENINNLPLGKITAEEKSQIKTCLMRFYCKQYQSTYPSIQNSLEINSVSPVHFQWKLLYLKYRFILRLPELNEELPSKMYSLLVNFMSNLDSPQQYHQFITKILKEYEENKPLTESEQIVLTFAKDLLNEIYLHNKSDQNFIKTFNDKCLNHLDRKFSEKFSTTHDAKEDKKGKSKINHLKKWLDQVRLLDDSIKNANKPDNQKAKRKLFSQLSFIERFLNGNVESCFKFRPTSIDEKEQLSEIRQIAKRHYYISLLEEYKAKRADSFQYFLYDKYYDDKTGRNLDNKTKKSRFVKVDTLINQLKNNTDSYEIIKTIANLIDEIKETNSDLKHVLYKMSNDVFNQLNDNSEKNGYESSPPRYAHLHKLNQDVFNIQLLRTIGYTDRSEDYINQAMAFSSYQDVFNKEGFWGRLSNSITNLLTTLVNRIQRRLSSTFHKTKEEEHKEITKIKIFMDRYMEFVKDNAVSEFYTELFILCDNAIRSTDNPQLHEALQDVKEQIVRRFKPTKSQQSHIIFDTSQIQRMMFSTHITFSTGNATTRNANFEYLQQKKNAEESHLIYKKLKKASADERLQLVYDALLLKINNRYLAEKVLASGKVQAVQSQENKVISTFENSLQKIGVPKAVLTVTTEPLKDYLNDQQRDNTVKIAKSVPLTMDVDKKSAEFAEKIRDMYRYQIQEVIDPYYLKSFIDILVERYFSALASGCDEKMILQHIYNNCQKHNWLGFGMTGAGEKEFKDEQGKPFTKSLKMENILSRAGVVVYDEKGNPHYYTMSENYDSSSCQYNYYGFVVLDKEQLPKDMVEIKDERLISTEIKAYFKGISTSILINNEQNNQEDASEELVRSVIQFNKERSTKLGQSHLFKSINMGQRDTNLSTESSVPLEVATI